MSDVLEGGKPAIPPQCVKTVLQEGACIVPLSAYQGEESLREIAKISQCPVDRVFVVSDAVLTALSAEGRMTLLDIFSDIVKDGGENNEEVQK